jgi:hypothetical protein
MSQTCHIAFHCIIPQLLCTSVWYINHVTNVSAERLDFVRVKRTDSRRVRIQLSYKIWMRKIRICPATVQWLTSDRSIVLITIWVFFFSRCNSPEWATALLPYLHDHTQDTPHSVRLLADRPTRPDNTQHTKISPPQAGFEPTIPAKRTALDRRLRTRGYRDR